MTCEAYATTSPSLAADRSSGRYIAASRIDVPSRREPTPTPAGRRITATVEGEMETYDPHDASPAEAWLSLEKGERIDLVGRYHERQEVELPNPRLHAVFHAVVETQLATGDPPEAGAALRRLRDEGLDRHQALHAIGMALAHTMHGTLHDPVRFSDPNEEYVRELEDLTAEKW